MIEFLHPLLPILLAVAPLALMLWADARRAPPRPPLLDRRPSP